MIKRVLVTKEGKAYVTDSDRQEDVIVKAKEDSIISYDNYAFIIITPPRDEKFTPINEWCAAVNPDKDLPFALQLFYNKDDQKRFIKIAKKAVSKWARGRIFINQKDVVIKDGENWVKDCENVLVDYDATVYGYGKSFINANGIARVIAYDKTEVHAYSGVHVEAHDNVRVEAYQSVTVYADSNTSIYACNNTSIEIRNFAQVGAFDNCKVVAHDDTTIFAHDNSAIEINGYRHAEGDGNAKLIIPSTSFANSNKIRTKGNAVLIQF